MVDFVPKNRNYIEAVSQLFARVPFHSTLNITLDEIKPGIVLAHMDREEGLTQQNGYFHAGALIGFADTVAGAAAYSLMPEGEGILSVNFSVSMLRPAAVDRIRAEGRVIKAGKRIYFTEAKIYEASMYYGEDDGNDRLLVNANITMTVA